MKIPKCIAPGIYPELPRSSTLLTYLAMEYFARKLRLPLRPPQHSVQAANTGISFGSVLSNWAALVALWALPYLTLLDRLDSDAARSQVLQWSLVLVGALGVGRILYVAWRQTRDPAWRTKHGLAPRERPNTPAS